jgi:cation transport regulator
MFIWPGLVQPERIVACPTHIDDLPPPIQAHLPAHAQEIYLSAFNSAWAQYPALSLKERESAAHRVAWAAVKRKYQKIGGRWIVRERG